MKELGVRLASVLVAMVVACAPSSGPDSSSTSPPIAIASSAASTSPVASIAPQPSSLATGAPTEAPDIEGKTIDWGIYRSVALGIEFEYPRASIGRGPLPNCAPKESGDGVFLDRLFISGNYERSLPAGSVLPATADAAADAFIAGSAITGVLRASMEVGGRAAVAVGYRFGGLNRYGEVTFVAARGHIYAFAWEAGVFDCVATNGFGGPQVYAHVINTVRFLS